MGLFDRKYCSVCGQKIGLLGNRKLEDGNLCKDCAGKLSPWFSDRRHSTVDEIKSQLAYRESNAAEVAAFHVTRSLGKYTKLLLDEDQRKFMVTSASNLASANPDVLDYSQVTGCDLDVQESRSEKKTTDKDGKSVSYDPPRYEYSYNFYVTIFVNHPYFDEIKYSLSNGYIKTGERPMTGAPAGWRVKKAITASFPHANDYYECLNLGGEIKEAVMNMRQEARDEIAAANAPKKAVTCPYCGASTVPDENGCCEYCGSALG